jgi:hypothetical protein
MSYTYKIGRNGIAAKTLCSCRSGQVPFVRSHTGIRAYNSGNAILHHEENERL